MKFVECPKCQTIVLFQPANLRISGSLRQLLVTLHCPCEEILAYRKLEGNEFTLIHQPEEV